PLVPRPPRRPSGRHARSQTHPPAQPPLPSAAPHRCGRDVRRRPPPRRARRRGAGEDGGQDGRGDGGAHRGERRRADRVRHDQGGREGCDDRQGPARREVRGQVRAVAAASMITTALVHSDAYGRFDYRPEHPLRMERLGLTWRLMEAYGLTTLPNATVHAPAPASERALEVWHTREYLEVLKAANGGVAPPHAERYGLGAGDNPVFPGLWDAARLGAGGSLLAADLVGSEKVTRAFHFAGGLHHALPRRASGFCYVNDAVLAILQLKARGLRVAYVDIDAHHGDGVQYAFYDDPS